jgi:magnesium-protoporphyrin IX monomethyl ester (oxidative) cyclase
MRPLFMDNRNVLLLYPTIIGEIPNCIAQIASVFEDEGFNVTVSVNTFKRPLTNEDFLNLATEVDAKIIAISTLTFEILSQYKLIKSFKERGFTVIVGGPHATTRSEEVVENGADIVVRNEGEDTVRELCKLWKGESLNGDDPEELKKKWNARPEMGLKVPDIISENIGDGLASILGITYFDKVENKIKSTPPRKRIVDLASLPPPNYDLFDHFAFADGDGTIRGTHRIFTSRGCPAKCKFCDWGVFGQRVTFQNMPRIIGEIKRRVDKYGTTNFRLADDVFTANKRHVQSFCEEIVKISPRIEWQANTRAEFVTEEMLTLMKKSGCYMVAFGLESGDQETLDKVDKKCTVETNIKAAKMAAAAGLKVYGCLMVGFPWETPKSIDNTIKMVKEIWDDVFLFQVSGSLIPFPGTRIYDEHVKKYPKIKDYWLKEKYQKFGIQTYQNNVNPYKVSTYYQRNLFDDSYIQDEGFFDYTQEYKDKIGEFVFLVGRHNLENIYAGKRIKQKVLLALSKISYFMYKKFPKLEKYIVGNLYSFYSLFTRKGKRAKAENIRSHRRGFGKSSAKEFMSRRLATAQSKASRLSYHNWV